MNKYSLITVKKVCFLALAVAFLSTSCGSGKTNYPNTPEGVTRKLLDSLQENDANKYLDLITPVDRKQPGFFFYRQLVQGIMSGIGLGAVDAAKLKISFTNLEINEISNDGQYSTVHVTGKLRDLNLALEQDFATEILVIKLDNQWLCSISGENQQLGSEDTPQIPTEEGFISGDIYVMPSTIVLWGPDSSRQGYRAVSIIFNIKNISNKSIAIYPFAQGISYLDTQNGYQYPAQISIMASYDGFPNITIPSGFIVWGSAGSEIPNTIEEFSVQVIKLDGSLYEIPLSLSSMKDNGISRTKDFPAYTLDNVKSFKGSAHRVDNIASISNFAETTFRSARYNNESKFLEITFHVKNIYGYDLRQNDAEIEIITNAAIARFTMFGDYNSGITVAPGSEADWTFYVKDQDLSTWLFQNRFETLVALFLKRDSRDPGANQEPMVYTLHYISPEDYK